MRNCAICGQPIHPERLEALPDTTTCTTHSQAKRTVVFPVYSHKTAPEMVVISGNNEEAIRLARRANNRER